MKNKDKEMMTLRGKVLESREEYFSNLQRLDATLTKKTTESATKKKEEADDLIGAYEKSLRRNSFDGGRINKKSQQTVASNNSPKKA